MARRSLRQSSGAAGGLAARYEARYEVLGHIGSGSFGSVHLVRYKGGYKGQEGAVRVRSTAVVKIAELSNMKSEAKQQAKDEVVRLAELNHPNIVGYYESFLLDNRLHIIMEYANGGTLEARINQARVKQAAGGAGARLGVEDAKVKNPKKMKEQAKLAAKLKKQRRGSAKSPGGEVSISACAMKKKAQVVPIRRLAMRGILPTRTMTSASTLTDTPITLSTATTTV